MKQINIPIDEYESLCGVFTSIESLWSDYRKTGELDPYYSEELKRYMDYARRIRERECIT